MMNFAWVFLLQVCGFKGHNLVQKKIKREKLHSQIHSMCQRGSKLAKDSNSQKLLCSCLYGSFEEKAGLVYKCLFYFL